MYYDCNMVTYIYIIGVGGGTPLHGICSEPPPDSPCRAAPAGILLLSTGRAAPHGSPPPPRASPRPQPGPCLGPRMSVRLSGQNRVAAGRPFREKVPFSLNSARVHENGGISPLFTHFGENGQKDPKCPPAVPLAQILSKPMGF